MTIEDKALEFYPKKEKQNKKGTGTYDLNFPRRKAYIKGANYIIEVLESFVDRGNRECTEEFLEDFNKYLEEYGKIDNS